MRIAGKQVRPPPKTELVQKTPRPRRRKASGSNITRLTSVRLDLVSKSVKISLTRERANGREDGEGGESPAGAAHTRPRPHPTRQQLRVLYCFAPGRDAGAEPASVRSEGMTSMAVATFLPACASYEAFTLAPSLDVRKRGLPAIQLDRCPIIHFESAPHHAEESGRDVHRLGARVHFLHRSLDLSRPGLLHRTHARRCRLRSRAGRRSVRRRWLLRLGRRGSHDSRHAQRRDHAHGCRTRH